MAMRLFALASVGLALVACTPEEAVDKPAADEVAQDTEATGAVRDLSVSEVQQALKHGNVRLIDVRTAEEVAEGAIPGAEHIALDDFDPARLDLSDGREVILYCRSGRRSGIVAERLTEYTGQPAEHLAGGINAWREAGGAVE